MKTKVNYALSHMNTYLLPSPLQLNILTLSHPDVYILKVNKKSA